MLDPALRDLLNQLADVTDRMGPVLRSPALDLAILEMMTENIELLLTQVYKIQSVLFMES